MVRNAIRQCKKNGLDSFAHTRRAKRPEYFRSSEPNQDFTLRNALQQDHSRKFMEKDVLKWQRTPGLRARAKIRASRAAAEVAPDRILEE